MCFSKLEWLLVMMNKERMQTEHLAFIIQAMSKTKGSKAQRKQPNKQKTKPTHTLLWWWYWQRSSGRYSHKIIFFLLCFSTGWTQYHRLSPVCWKAEPGWQTFKHSRQLYLTISAVPSTIINLGMMPLRQAVRSSCSWQQDQFASAATSATSSHYFFISFSTVSTLTDSLKDTITYCSIHREQE